MLRKLTLALVAAASLSAVALAPSAASAHIGGGGFHGFRHFGGFGIGYVGTGYDDGSCYVVRRVLTPFGFRLRTVYVCG
jgi:hypothetical protein